MVGSRHKKTGEPRAAEYYRNENGWGEVDNCWGQLGYINVMLYKPPSYSDIIPRKWHRPSKLGKLQRIKSEFRAERNAHIKVRQKELGDILAVALRNAAIPYVDSTEV